MAKKTKTAARRKAAGKVDGASGRRSRRRRKRYAGLTGAQIFHEMLLEEGVEFLFGFPGGAVLPFFAAHILLVVVAWTALLYYLYARRYLWWAFLLPSLTPLLFVLFNFFEGSRYEG